MDEPHVDKTKAEVREIVEKILKMEWNLHHGGNSELSDQIRKFLEEIRKFNQSNPDYPFKFSWSGHTVEAKDEE